MRVPVWYVLTSDGEREHRDLVLASAHVLRRVDPATTLGLALDERSAAAADRDGIRFSEIFEHVRLDNCSEHTPLARHRSIKLRLRLETKGDFCYVDSDTLAVRALDCWPKDVPDVGMVFDCIPGAPNRKGPSEYARAMFTKIGWPYPGDRYFNSGVSLWRDTASAHRFAEAWYRNWQTSTEAGVMQDQPALAQTDKELRSMVSVLPHMFNAQVNAWPGYARDAVFWHFFYTQKERGEIITIFDQLLQDVAHDRDLSWQKFDEARRRNYPWLKSKGFKWFLLAGNYGGAVAELPHTSSRLLKRVLGSRK